MNSYLERLDDILLSKNVREEFFKAYIDDDFRGYLLDILPEVEDCRVTQQDNPWHVYDCLNHILKSVEVMNSLTDGMDNKERRLLSYTMFLHDMGKPQCLVKEFSTFHNRLVDKFPHHNLAGVEIAKRALPHLDFNENEQCVIVRLIKDHDIFISLTIDENKKGTLLTTDLVKDMQKDYDELGSGKKILFYLVKVGISDNKAQNTALTQASLKLIEAMESMVNNLEDKSSTQNNISL